MKATIISTLKIGRYTIKNTEQLAKLALSKGKRGICPRNSSLKCISIETELYTYTGVIKWANEFGQLISENGYCYDINHFLNKKKI
ncbi:hypothetical protein AB4865_10435 [Capnocytophaga sp. ARDL2]|uniref:hypothetical protein n=1 Tax=Capnocytophaga sp. ARDL2 TaxID=3238809 RepID=UPI0035560CF0